MKRVLSMLLTLVIIFSVIPITTLNVRAEEESGGLVKELKLSVSYANGVETIAWDNMGEDIDAIYINIFMNNSNVLTEKLTDVSTTIYEYKVPYITTYFVEVYGMNGTMPVYYGQEYFTTTRRDSAAPITDYHWEGMTLCWEPSDRAVRYNVNKYCIKPNTNCYDNSNSKQTATSIDLTNQIKDDYDLFSIYTWAEKQGSIDAVTYVVAADYRGDVEHYDITCTEDGNVSWNIDNDSVKKIVVKCLENNNIGGVVAKEYDPAVTSCNVRSSSTIYNKPSTVFVMAFDENDKLCGYGKQVVNIKEESVKNIRFDGKTVTWDKVSWAKYYIVNMISYDGSVTNITTSTQRNSMTVSNLQTGCIIAVTPRSSSKTGNTSYSETIYDAHEHAGIYVRAKDPNCGESGNIEYFECLCGKIFFDRECTNEILDKESIIKPATGEHNYDGQDYINDGNGNHYRECLVCKAKSKVEACEGGQAATCIKKSECAKCGEEYGDYAGHKASESFQHDENKHWGSCEVCLQDIAEEEHIAVVVPGKEATCTEEGLTEGKKCKVCDYVIEEQNVIAKTAHTEEVIAGKEATCTEEGLTEGKKCKVCDYVIEEQNVIAKTAHTEEVIAGKEATCTEEGLTEGKKCKICGVVTVEQSVVAKTNHSWNEGIVTKEPTKEAEGEKTYTCKVCNETKTEVIGKLSNDDEPSIDEPVMDYGVVEVAAKGKLDVKAAILKKLDGKETAEITGYIVSNKKLASVSKKGLLKTKKVGEITVTAIHKTGKKTYEEVESIKVIIKDTKFEKKIILNNPSEQINLFEYLKEVPKDQPVKFTTNKKGRKIVDLNEDTGLLVPKKAGKVNIVCLIGEGKNAVKKTCKVTIKK